MPSRPFGRAEPGGQLRGEIVNAAPFKPGRTPEAGQSSQARRHSGRTAGYWSPKPPRARRARPPRHVASRQCARPVNLPAVPAPQSRLTHETVRPRGPLHLHHQSILLDRFRTTRCTLAWASIWKSRDLRVGRGFGATTAHELTFESGNQPEPVNVRAVRQRTDHPAGPSRSNGGSCAGSPRTAATAPPSKRPGPDSASTTSASPIHTSEHRFPPRWQRQRGDPERRRR